MLLNRVSVASLLMVIAITAVGAEEKKEVSLNVSSIEDTMYPDRNVNVKDVKKGVFVTAVGGWSSVYQKTANYAKERLVARGIKVVDKPEDADVGIQFVGTGFNLEEVETGQTDTIDSGMATRLGYGLATGNVAMVMGEMWHPSLVNTPLIVRIAARMVENPTVSGRGKLSGDNDEVVLTSVIYQSNAEGAAVSAAVFRAYLEKFIDNHFVFDATTATTITPNKMAEAATK